MGKGTRIRWQNVAKLGAGIVACIALVAGLPALLESPKPPPLPADVGLMHVADRSPAASLSASRAASHRHRSTPGHERHEDARSRQERPPEPERRPPSPRSSAPQPDHHEAPRTPQPTPVAAPTPSPPPTPAPAPAYSPPPPAPAPIPVTGSSSPAPSDSGGGGEESGGSEFGFEH